MPTEKRPRVLETANPREGLRQMRGIFWDTDVERLDLEKNKPFIIARMLEKGGMRGMIWVEAVYPESDIVDVICHRRDLSPIVRNYYMSRYHIPQEAVTVSGNWWMDSPAPSGTIRPEECTYQSSPREQIVIYVRGGMVQDVMASMPNINVAVVDYDIPEEERMKGMELPYHIF